MPKKLSYQQVQAVFSNRGYILVSEKYEHSRKKLEVLCPVGHRWSICLEFFKKANCGVCSGNKKFTLEFIEAEFNKKGYKLISKNYTNCYTKLDVVCPNGHDYCVSFNNFYNHKSICSSCTKRKRLGIKDIRKLFEKEGYVLLTQHYKNVSQKLQTICPEGHIYVCDVDHFLGGKRRCSECRGNKSYTIENIKEIVEKDGYQLISKKYVNALSNIELKCPKGHLYSPSFHSFKNGGSRCPTCGNNGVSKAEKEIFEFIKLFYPDATENNRTIISPLELDIYIPNLNLAIEYGGLYWHSEEYKDKNYHYNKMKLCNDKGIRLITVFEDEWLQRKDQVKNFILSAINKNKIKLMARKTEIKPTNKIEAIQFLEENHIQGAPVFQVSFGLYYNNDLQALITGNKHHRQGFKEILVLNRLAFKSNVSISGGSSKLLSALIKYAKDNDYKKIISWSDNRWSEGNVYIKTGFSLSEKLLPDYSYIVNNERTSKQSCQKKNLTKKGAIGGTEKEMALSLGFRRIWDCGKKRWEINL